MNSIDEGIWNRVWAFTDDGRPLELAKLDIALVPRVSPQSFQSLINSLPVRDRAFRQISRHYLVFQSSFPI